MGGVIVSSGSGVIGVGSVVEEEVLLVLVGGAVVFSFMDLFFSLLRVLRLVRGW